MPIVLNFQRIVHKKPNARTFLGSWHVLVRICQSTLSSAERFSPAIRVTEAKLSKELEIRLPGQFIHIYQVPCFFFNPLCTLFLFTADGSCDNCGCR
jgi:hypothetical protein